MTATAITMSEKLDADIYIFDDFNDCRGVARRLKETHVFHQVRLISNTLIKGDLGTTIPSKVKVYLKTLLLFLRTDKEVKRIIRNNKYSSLYIYHRQQCYVRMICMYFVKHFKGVKLFFYDEGIGSYYSRELFETHFMTKAFELLYCRKTIKNSEFRMRVFSPKLYLLGFEKNPPVPLSSSIKKLDQIDGFKDINERIFDLTGNTEIKQRVIILDTVREEEFCEEGQELFKNIVKLIVDELGDVVIKKHPRDLTAEEKNYSYIKQGGSFENYCYTNDMNNKVIISSYSTGTFAPKLFFDQEPVVILLYNILETYYKDAFQAAGLFAQYKMMYRNPQRVFIPNDINELKRILQRLSETKK